MILALFLTHLVRKLNFTYIFIIILDNRPILISKEVTLHPDLLKFIMCTSHIDILLFFIILIILILILMLLHRNTHNFTDDLFTF